MSVTPAAPRWRVLFTPRWLGWHLFAVVAFTGMLWLGDWQFRRAIGGNPLSWAYTFEWPVFAIFGAVFWVKTVRDELRPAERQEATVSGPVEASSLAERQLARTGAGGRAVGTVSGDDDLSADEATELAEYNAYLATLSNAAPKRRGPR